MDLYDKGKFVYTTVEGKLTDLTEDAAEVWDKTIIYYKQHNKNKNTTESTDKSSNDTNTNNDTTESINSTVNNTEVKNKKPVPRKSKKTDNDDIINIKKEKENIKINEKDGVKENDNKEIKNEKKVKNEKVKNEKEEKKESVKKSSNKDAINKNKNKSEKKASKVDHSQSEL